MKLESLLETSYKPIFYHRHGSGQIRGSVAAWLELMGATKEDVLKARERAKSSQEYHDLLAVGLNDVSSTRTAFRFKPNDELLKVRKRWVDSVGTVDHYNMYSAASYYNVLPNGKIDASRNGNNRWNIPSLEPIKDSDPVEAVYKTFVQAFKQLKEKIEVQLGRRKVSHRPKGAERTGHPGQKARQLDNAADAEKLIKDVYLDYERFRQWLFQKDVFWSTLKWEFYKDAKTNLKKAFLNLQQKLIDIDADIELKIRYHGKTPSYYLTFPKLDIHNLKIKLPQD